MSRTKTEFKYFTIFKYKEEQEYLRMMHSSGWELTGISFPGFYHFQECTPEDVVYQLDYNQNGTAYKGEYVQIFADCGWEYMFDFVGYSYFRKPSSQMEGPEEIFCDDESRMEMMKRVLKGRVMPLLYIFLGIILPQIFIQMSQSHRGAGNRGIAIVFLILFVVYLGLFISFGIQFFSYEKKIKEPDRLNKVKYVGLLLVTIALCALVVFGITKFWKPLDSRYKFYTSKNQCSIGAEYLNETIRHEMELKDGDELGVTLQVLKGDIHLLICLNDKNPIYEGTVSKQNSFALPIHEDGTYTIIITGEDAEGSFNFQIK